MRRAVFAIRARWRIASDSDDAVRLLTQIDNDASGNPQRIVGRPLLLSVLAAALCFLLVSTLRAKKARGDPYIANGIPTNTSFHE